MAGFMPAVWYSKEPEQTESRGSSEKVDAVGGSAKILKGDHIVTAQETFRRDKNKRRFVVTCWDCEEHKVLKVNKTKTAPEIGPFVAATIAYELAHSVVTTCDHKVLFQVSEIEHGRN